jgi:hypothetical protein
MERWAHYILSSNLLFHYFLGSVSAFLSRLIS